MDSRISELLYMIVKDLEDTRDIIGGYSYVRTIRNILTGNEKAVIAPNFKNKKYYGLIDRLSIKENEEMMNKTVRNNILSCIYTEHGTLYCTPDYYNNLVLN